MPGRVRVQKLIFSCQKIAAHTGFHIDGCGQNFVGRGDHFMGMLNPLGGIGYQFVVGFIFSSGCFGSLLALGHQLCFSFDKGCYLAAELVKVDLAPCFSDKTCHIIHCLCITDLSAKRNGRLGDLFFPFVDGLFGLVEQLHLSRVVVNGLFQCFGQFMKGFPTVIIRVEKPLFAGQQIAPHTGFHVNGGRLDLHGLLNHFVRMVHTITAAEQRIDTDRCDDAENHQQDQRKSVPRNYFRF